MFLTLSILILRWSSESLIWVDLGALRRGTLVLRQPRGIVNRRRGHVLHVIAVRLVVGGLLRPYIGPAWTKAMGDEALFEKKGC